MAGAGAAPVRQRAWHALRGEPRGAAARARAHGDGPHVPKQQVATSEAPTPIRRNPRPVLAMLRAPQIGHPQTLTEIRLGGVPQRTYPRLSIARDAAKIPAALAASKQEFLAFLDPASLASFGATGVAMRGEVQRRRVFLGRGRGGHLVPRGSSETRDRMHEGETRQGDAMPRRLESTTVRRGHDLRTIRASWLARLDPCGRALSL